MLDTVNTLVSLGGILMQVLVIILIISIVFNQKENIFYKLASKYSLLVVFLVSGGGALISLYYSEIIKYEPCLLCWYQRIFIFSIAFIFAFALYKKDKNIIPYGIILSSAGLLISAYHLFVQYSSNPFVCNILESTSCTTNYFIKFGYMTIPVLSFTSLALMLIVLIIAKKK